MVEGGRYEAFLGREPWDTATDVSRTGEMRRGREGNSWDVGLSFEVSCVRGRGLCVVFEGLLDLRLGEGGPSDNVARAEMHASRSQSDLILGSRLNLSCDKGIWVTKAIGSGRVGGGYA